MEDLEETRLLDLIHIFWPMHQSLQTNHIAKEWARTEGNLHRALASKILASYGRTPLARPICDQIFHYSIVDIAFHSGIQTQVASNQVPLVGPKTPTWPN